MNEQTEHNRHAKHHNRRLLFVFVFILGLLAGIFSDRYLNQSQLNKLKCFEIRKDGYEFINPLIECGSSEIPQELTNFKNRVSAYIKKAKEKQQDLDISVYFREMNNGPWFGINENRPYYPASLLKVPIMMSYLKKAEREPSILEKTLKFNEQSIQLTQHFQPTQKIEPGKSYGIEELIERMITYSDNNAKML
ncbi:MAG TPA: serine hydrolase, partial [Candidatus Omnitrophota bacterium]|nr:serine hydrolase [Candidatus Omnitrophota bacterium]